MKHFFTRIGQLAAILLLIVSCSNQAQAQVTTQGDLVFTAVGSRGSAGTDSFSFVLLKAVNAGNTINFTDRGWNGSSWNQGYPTTTTIPSESTLTWTVGAGGLAVGTEVLIVGTTATVIGGSVNGTVTSTASGGVGFDLRAADQVIAYTGNIDSPPYTVIAGIHWNSCSGAAADATWDVAFNGSTGCTVTAIGASLIPPQSSAGATPTLSPSVSSFYLERTGGIQNVAGKFNCTTANAPFASAAAARTAILNRANWDLTSSGGVSTGLTGCTYIGVNAPTISTQPVNDTLCAGTNSTTFSVTAGGTGPFTYKWQVSTDNGGSYNNVNDGGNYANTATATITVTNAPSTFDGYLYRCNVTNSGGTTASNGALLKIDNGLPTIGVQPNDATICPNGSTILSATASNGAAITYKWQVSTNGGGSWANITDGTNYANSATTSLSINSAPTSFYNYQYRMTATNACGTSNSNAATLTFRTSWTGGSSTVWGTAGNWSCNVVPDANTDVIINVAANQPTLTASGTAHNITINSSAILTIGSNNTLTVTGDMVNLGAFNAVNTGATTTFNSAAAQTLPTATYANVTLSGGGNKNLGGTMNVIGILNFTGNTKLFLGANALTLDATASITGYNSTNYISTNGTGSLKRNNINTASGTVAFPIGTNSSYTPLQLVNTGTIDNFSARVIDGVYANYSGTTPSGGAIATRVVNKTWFVSEDVAGSSNVTLTAQWNTGDEQPSFNRSSVTLSHYTNGKWQGNTLGPVSGSNPYFISRSGITSFSPFGVGNGGTALPVTIKDFSGTYSNGATDLQWDIAEEAGISTYIVERSENGQDFTAIGQVAAAGKHAYSFTDAKVKAGTTYYYRLNIAGLSGAPSYSRTVRINTATDKNGSMVHVKNPVKNNLELELNSTGADVANIGIYDLTGRKLMTSTYEVQNGIQQISIPANPLLSGHLYIVRVSLNNNTYELKVTKE